MANSKDYIEYLLEQLSPLGYITAKRMFGGHGIYCEDRMFGLVGDDELYLKVDDINRLTFEEAGLEPFCFVTKNGPTAVMSYYQAPSTALDDQDVLLDWARLGIDAALRAPAKRKKKKAKK